jgi:hypothetical protein
MHLSDFEDLLRQARASAEQDDTNAALGALAAALEHLASELNRDLKKINRKLEDMQ